MGGANGQFLKGQSGNSRCSPRDWQKVAELARSYTKEAIDRLVELMRSGNDEPVRRTAAQALFERVWAKALRFMFRDDTNAVFHVHHHSAAATLANDLVMSRYIVADIRGHSSLSNTAHYAHAKPDALLDIASRK